ncbi:glutamate dehydrogenase [Nocardioides alpinus]|uniref:Glutamate dehydrogenase n=1 Tax=Nocardioides alpinus TaxID=748909 RepID=A0A1I0VCF0_9ACTN|nr:NAD-glutamate dehydrogenase [Nocardioides alpinus]PKH37185.1 NAD-glutamate dehydrogenase [Nocardioides alpinus]SFA73723.1 glutamate dehydrogenase [Nocardioides alpinus]
MATPEETKDHQLDAAAQVRPEWGDLLRDYYRHVAPEEVAERSPEDLFGALASHRELAVSRPQGTATVRVVTPTSAESGWSASGRSVVEVVTDDMPFLVDSVTMELNRLGHNVHSVVHPQFSVDRDITGALQHVTSIAEDLHADTSRGSEAGAESWMHVEIDRTDDAEAAEITEGVQRVLRDVRESVEDWAKMHAQVLAVVAGLTDDPPPLPADELDEGRDFLTWLADDHFTFLGYREYQLEADEDAPDECGLRAVPGSGLGILRHDQDLSSAFAKLPPIAKAKAREKTLLVLAKANSRATVHRPAYLDYVGVKTFGADGEVVGERRFLGLFSSAAYTESVTRIPVLREKVTEVMRRAGFDPRSHAGKALMDTLENYPRDELFHTSPAELAPVAQDVMFARERRQLRAFVRRDTYGRYVSVLVYLPRDRYSTAVRERFSDILRDDLGGEHVEFTARVNESTTARVHFVVHPPKGGHIPDVDVADLERRLTEASRSWRDDFMASVVSEYGEERGSQLARAWSVAFPEAYKEDYSPQRGSADVGRIEDIEGAQGIDLALFDQDGEAGTYRRGESRLKVFRVGEPLSLSTMLPMLTSMGVEVVDERPYSLEGLARPSYIYEFGLRHGRTLSPHERTLFAEALRAVWDGFNEIDGFNQLVLAAGLTWRQATVLRAYAKYLKQGNSPFALDYIEEALRSNVDITRLLVELFESRFDPGRGERALEHDAEARVAKVEAVEERLAKALDDVVSLDHDRILRSYRTLVRATLRTNFFQRTAAGDVHPYMSFKLEPSAIPDLPEPRPRFEIFVYSPRVEGSHLRFGAVARGGLRWSDRRDDFRTEVLGLVKAQMVKNTVIVPVGAKGAFFCKQLPDPSDRDAWLAEGVACYKTFISGLLDITDNLVDGEPVPPREVVRHDGDDSYLVVAADKGTATFSDIANGVAKDYGFWLGDAFASGGSVGYDHKAMGITAKGAWVSVQRHFREMGIDCQAEDFTAVGIGDMSGDVFGNGLLCSEHTRLVAAFDHRDIFIDPDPDAASSYVERQRLFDLPRSSWKDYDSSLISEGGGVWPRSAKSIPVSAQARAVLGLASDVTALTPAELMKAILVAPVDLLWNGGIGTYVKASEETNADAGDKANDAIRVNGEDLRATCIGEGGNLGFTQLGRVEYARYGAGGRGGRMNTDFIDNSAGVDTSDHEVNIKILLDRVVRTGAMDEAGRNTLLAAMTDEVGQLVLRDNYEQNLALANAEAHAPSLLHVHEEWMRALEKRGVLNRDLEGLPTTRQVRRRLDRKQALSGPELSVLLAWTKIVLADELIDSDLPDDPYLREDLLAYFPSRMKPDLEAAIEDHPLRREIIVTQVVNDLVNGAGMTFWPRLAGETGASPADLTRANFVAREIFGSLPLRQEMAALDNQVPAERQTRMRIEMRTLVERASRWLVTNRRPPLDSQATVDFFRGRVQAVMAELPSIMSGRELDDYRAREKRLSDQGVPDDLASRVAGLAPAYALLGIVETADRLDLDPVEVARVHFALGERLGLPALVERIFALPRDDRWQTMARAAVRDDLYGVHQQLTAQVLGSTAADDSAPARVAEWENADEELIGRSAATLEEICREETAELARLSVGLRVVRGLLS